MKYFTFSLDFELAWECSPVRKQPPGKKWRALFTDKSESRECLSSILSTFEKYSIPATWAVVGHLFLEKCSRDCHYRTERIDEIDPYTDLNQNPLYFASDIVSMINDASVNHEIAGHSFSHPLFTDLHRSEARSELRAMVDAASVHNVELNSFVFPRNEIAHEDLLKEFGIDTYRGKTIGKQHTLASGVKSIVSSQEAFFRCPTVTPESTGDLTRLPASQLLRDERWWFLQPWRVKRTIDSMKDGEWLHLTVHPYNFMQEPRLHRTLAQTLQHVDKARRDGELEVVTMAAAHQNK